VPPVTKMYPPSHGSTSGLGSRGPTSARTWALHAEGFHEARLNIENVRMRERDIERLVQLVKSSKVRMGENIQCCPLGQGLRIAAMQRELF